MALRVASLALAKSYYFNSASEATMKNIYIDIIYVQIDGLVQERHNSSALAMELRLSCNNPPKWYSYNKSNYKNLRLRA